MWWSGSSRGWRRSLDLDPDQRAAAEHRDGHVLVLAGAGTGKTRTLVARAAWLVRQGVEPRRLLLLTFTRRAAREMVHRLRHEVGEAARDIPAGTFHRFCLSTMRRMPRRFGVGDATVIDRDDQLALVRLCRAPHRVKGRRFPTASQLLRVISYARNTNANLGAYLAEHTTWDPDTMRKAVAIARDYRSRKRDGAYLDYDDLLHVFASRLRRDPGTRERVRAMFDHVLVDEMQDTNPLQWLILDGIRDPALLFCVGDDAQSIYGFRGADFANVHAFSERVPGSTVLRLERNYRSTQQVLDLANWLLDASPVDYRKRLVATRPGGPLPRLLDFDDEQDEADWVATDLVERSEGGAPFGDHMVITRSAFAARALEAALVEREVPYRFVGGTQLFQAAHVKDLLALVRAASSPRDDLAWVRWLVLWHGVGDRTAARATAAFAERPSLEAALGWLEREVRSGPDIAEAVRRVAACIEDPGAAVRRATEELEPLGERTYPDWTSRRRDLELLAQLAGRHRTITGFLETYALDPISTTEVRQPEDEDHVLVVTAHSAKGTEAPVCYLVRVEPGIYPHSRSLGDPNQEEEERRVLYVAMTRAMDELVITRTDRRLGHRVAWGRSRGPRGTSAYLLEGLPGELVTAGTAGDGWDGDVIEPW